MGINKPMTESATATMPAPSTDSAAPETTLLTAPVPDNVAPLDKSPTAASAPVADSKPAAAEAVPSYDIQAPEGYNKDEFIKFASEHKIDPKVAQTLLDREVAAINTTFEKAAAEHKAEVAKWAEQLKTDKEFGGDAFKGNAARVATFVKQHATPGFIELLNKTGLGNHPDVVKTFHKLATLTGSDKMVALNAQPPAEKELSLSERLYPNMYPKK